MQRARLTLVALMLLLLPAPAAAQLWTPLGEPWFSEIQDIAVTGSYGFLIPNEGVTGTTDTLVACASTAGLAITCTTTNTLEVLGPVLHNGGTTGSAVIANSGLASGCQFDGATTAGHYVQLSTSVAGNCNDVGATLPGNGLRVIGTVTTTNGASGVYPVQMFSRGIVGTRGSVFASPLGTISYLPIFTTSNAVTSSPVVDTGTYIALEGRAFKVNASGGGAGGTFLVDGTGYITYYNNSSPLDGQLLIGNTANSRFDKSTLTAGTGISVTNAAGGITIAATGANAETWAAVTSDVVHAQSSTVLSDVTGLSWSACGSATEVWQFEISLILTQTGTVADWKFGFTVPASATMRWGATSADPTVDHWGMAGTGSTPNAAKIESDTLSAGSANLTNVLTLKGILLCSTTSGTVQLQFAQQVSNASDNTVRRGSNLIARKVSN